MFQPYFGEIPPALAIAFAAVVGAACLAFLRRRGFPLLERGAGRGVMLRIVLIATAFAVPTIVVDLNAPFPQDMNVPLPDALLFYPLIGLVAEVAFHLAPLTLLIALARLAGRDAAGWKRRLWGCIVLAACVEPVFQVATGWNRSPPWVLVYVGLHLFAFSLVQLSIFRRHGFALMYLFRAVYYLHWHIFWGYFRLRLLF